jgi:hypothetical protein
VYSFLASLILVQANSSRLLELEVTVKQLYDIQPTVTLSVYGVVSYKASHTLRPLLIFVLRHLSSNHF